MVLPPNLKVGVVRPDHVKRDILLGFIFLLFCFNMYWLLNHVPKGNLSTSETQLIPDLLNEDDIDVDIDEEDDQVIALTSKKVEKSSKIQITHLFSTFSSKSCLEQRLVQESWLKSSTQARKAGLEVEFLDFTLPDDKKCTPSFAKRYDLTWTLKHGVKDFPVSTIGEPFKLAAEFGQGQVFVYSNADIGVFPDFYERVWNWATLDYFSVENQLRFMKNAAKYLNTCFHQEQLGPPDHLQVCVEDTKVIYMHIGGCNQLWNEVSFEIALMAAQIRLKQAPNSSIKKIREFFMLSQAASKGIQQLIGTDSTFDWKTKIKDYSIVGPKIESLLELKNIGFAGTITRLDTVIEMNSSTTADEIVKTARISGYKHPGNDLFVFERGNIIEDIQKLGHPAGTRPFGLWITLAYVNRDIPFRRITGTKENPWTFHIGKGAWGGDAYPWIEGANRDPIFTLFLAGNFDKNSNGALRKSFTDSIVCQNSTRPWRGARFCNSVMEQFCSGNIRSACTYKNHIRLRDQKWYLSACEKLHSQRNGKINTPICELCNFFFKEKKFVCIKDKLKYCDTLGEGIC